MTGIRLSRRAPGIRGAAAGTSWTSTRTTPRRMSRATAPPPAVALVRRQWRRRARRVQRGSNAGADRIEQADGTRGF